MSRASTFVSKGGVPMGTPAAVALHEPAVWGFLGAFIYAGPRLAACIMSCRETGVNWALCLLEFAFALATGAIAAAAFSATAMNLIHVSDTTAIATTIGLLANPIAPKMIATASGVLNAALSSRLGRALQGDEKK